MNTEPGHLSTELYTGSHLPLFLYTWDSPPSSRVRRVLLNQDNLRVGRALDGPPRAGRAPARRPCLQVCQHGLPEPLGRTGGSKRPEEQVGVTKYHGSGE